MTAALHPLRPPLFAALLIGLSALTGCTRYAYDVVSPPEVAQPIAEGRWTVLTQDPLRYNLVKVEDRLVVRIFNTTNAPIQLLGDRSVVVDPGGESHALKTQTIAPDSYIKLVLPPSPAVIRRPGPNIGIGVGVGYGFGGYRRLGGRYFYPYGMYHWDHPYWYDTPQYYAVYDRDVGYWDWDGEGRIRLVLVYLLPNGETFSHEFGIARRRV